MKKYFLSVIILFLLVNGQLYSIDAPEIIQKVKSKYESIDNFSADFTQNFKWKLAGETQEQSGKILLQGEDKFRIETEDQLIISDGATLWTYSRNNNQVIIDNIQNADDAILPREIFMKFSKEYHAKLLHKENFNDKECFVLQLAAKNENLFIKQIKIWIDSKTWLTSKIHHVDINDNVTIYILNNISINKQISKNQFQYSIPADIEVIDMR